MHMQREPSTVDCSDTQSMFDTGAKPERFRVCQLHLLGNTCVWCRLIACVCCQVQSGIGKCIMSGCPDCQ